MISTRSIVLTGASFAALASALTVNTPSSLVQCQPAQLSWNGGSAPYYLSIIPGGQPSATPLESLPDQSGESYTWMVDLASGTSVTVQIRDSTGEINYSDQVTIQAGTTTDCSASDSSSSSGSSGSSGSSAAAGGSSSSRSSSGSSAAAVGSSASTALATSRKPLTTSSTGTATTGASTSATTSNTSGVGAAAAATTTGAASSTKVGFGLLAGGFLLALAA